MGFFTAEIEVKIKSPAIYAPILLSYFAPGDLVLFVGENSATAALSAYIVLPSADSPATLQAQAVAIFSTAGTNTKIVSAELRTVPTDPPLIDAAVRGLIADPGRSSSPIKLAIGTPYKRFSLRTNVQNGGVTTDPYTDGNFTIIRYEISGSVG